MNALDMMTLARANNKTYVTNQLLYNTKYGFHNSSRHPWSGSAFNNLNELFNIDAWKECNTVYMTKIRS